MAKYPHTEESDKRFLSRIFKATSCWIWNGTRGPLSKRQLGYGIFKSSNKTCQAHRYSYELFLGDIPEGMIVMHKCDNPLCVNPDHLKLGTQRDNIMDCVHKGRNSRGSRAPNAKLTEEQVREIKKRYKPYCRIDGGAALEKEYGVSNQVIIDIINGKRWKHVK